MVSYNSLDSLGCLMLERVSDEVTPINNLDQLKEAMPTVTTAGTQKNWHNC